MTGHLIDMKSFHLGSDLKYLTLEKNLLTVIKPTSFKRLLNLVKLEIFDQFH